METAAPKLLSGCDVECKVSLRGGGRAVLALMVYMIKGHFKNDSKHSEHKH